MLGKFFDRVLNEEENIAVSEKEPEGEIEELGSSVKKNRLEIFLAFLFFVGALALRLYFLYFVSDPQNPGDGWAGDVFHHWQIAYLTREVGLGQGFLRLWDLKGMEYFWGPLHPLLLILLFNITGSVSIVNARVLSLIFGALVVSVIYLIGNKFWNRGVGVAAAFLAAIHPVGILDDTFGLLEPIGYFLLLSGILLLEASPFLSGLIWGLASLVRAEAWIYGFLLLLLSGRILKKAGQLPKVFMGWSIVMVLYMKYLLDHTGNPIYPLWWNYLANAKGVWADEIIFTPYQLSVKPYLLVWFAISLVFLLIVLWKNKSKGSLFLVFGFANWVFIAGMMGLSHYLTGFQPWFWLIRFFQYPYIFLGFLISLLLLYIVPKYVKYFNRAFISWTLWIPILLIALIYQLIFWKPILDKYNDTKKSWTRTKLWAQSFAEEYKGGRVLINEGDPNFTYALVYFQGVEGKNIIGEMFDPFFYMEGDPFENWGENRETILAWIKKEDIRLIEVHQERERYIKLFEKEPRYFEFVKAIPESEWLIYRVYPERIVLE